MAIYLSVCLLIGFLKIHLFILLLYFYVKLRDLPTMDGKKKAQRTELGFVDSWQSGKSLTESLLYSLDHKVHCDVTFIVGEERKSIEAHKLILSVRSRVFEAMLTGPMAEQDSIVIPDVESDIFNIFLR